MTSSALLLLAGLAVQTAAPPQTPPASPVAESYFLFLQGRQLQDQGDNEGAIAALKKALTLTPKAAELHAELSGVYASMGRATESLTEAQAALAIEPDNREAHRIFGLVQAALAARTPDQVNAKSLQTQAIDHLEKALEGGVRDPNAELTLGRLYVDSGNYAKGIIRLQLFLLDQPGYPDALMLLSSALEETGRVAEATSALEDVIESQPNQLQARASLAGLYERAGRWAKAAEAWNDLATRSPRSSLTYRFRQASALVNAGDVEAGRKQLQDLSKIAPQEIAIWYVLAQAEARAGNPAGAEDAANHITALDAKDARGVLAMAGAKVAAKNYQAAIDLLDPRVKAASDADISAGLFARFAMVESDALEKSGDLARATKVLEDAYRKTPSDSALRYALTSAYERGKRFDEAEKLFRDVLAKEPENAEALNYLGYMLAERGQKLPEAVDLIKRALAIEVDNPSYLDSLGWAYFKQARLDDAREPLERAAGALPQVSLIQNHLGQLYFQLKRYRDAAGAFDRALAGDREGIEVDAVTRTRDEAKRLAGG